MKFFGRIAFLSAAFFCVAGADAQSEKTVSLTISPFHLAMPVVELTGEFALDPKFSLAAIGGYGGVKVENSAGNSINMPVLELGGQVAYYALGHFSHGMQIGGELLWIKIFPPKDEGVTFDANGIAVGPLIGYKWIAGFGLTLFAQIGYEFLFAKAKAKDDTGQEAEASEQNGLPLLNLNVGWSF